MKVNEQADPGRVIQFNNKTSGGRSILFFLYLRGGGSEDLGPHPNVFKAYSWP